jgi:methylated-DNA-[protein]-cysteine S-methyltransferase
MKTYGLAVFATAMGHCGIVWSDSGVAGVQLPESTAAATRQRLERRFPSATEAAPPPEIERAIDAVRALLRGEHSDISAVALDLDAKPEFERSVYEIARTIPPGETLTYGDIAKRLGIPRDAREVGRALGDNPIPIIVPCHRVVAADGRMHGFSGTGGVKTKLKLLEIEGYERVPGPSLFDVTLSYVEE